jgi:predicted PurR-regulated permease PerM
MADQSSKRGGRAVLFALVLAGVYLSGLVLGPFLEALTWALIFAILFRGTHAALLPRLGPNGAALVTTLVVAIVIVAPGVALIPVLAREAPQVADYLKQTSVDAPLQIQRIWDAVKAWSPVPIVDDPGDVMTRGAQRALAFMTSHAGEFAANFFATLGNLVAMLFALFFMLRDSDVMSRTLRDRLPFSEQESDRLMSDTRDLVVASVGAGAVVAAAQGLIGGLAFWLLGIGPPVFWGAVTALCSLLPVVGASIVWLPVGVALVLSGDTGRGVSMLLVGALGISMVDNVLRPLLLSGKTSVSGFVVFFGLLGGAAAFGFIGLVIGPIILVTTARLLEILRRPGQVDGAVPEHQLVGVAGR